MARMVWHRGLVIVTALVLSACGQGMVSSGGGSANGGSAGTTGPDIEFDAIQSETVAAEKALADAEAALDGLVRDGRVVIPEVQLSGVAQKSLTGIAEKLEAVLDQLYQKITLPVQKAKGAINQARAQIAASIARLDPNNPAHQSMIARLQEMLQRLDDMEAKVSGVYKRLASKIDLLVGKIDRLIARLNGGNPLLIIAIWELQEVRRVIVEFRDKLANT